MANHSDDEKRLQGNQANQAMPLVKSTDAFIQRSLQLLETAPSTTRISITYGSYKKEQKVVKNRADSFVTFKVYEPVSGGLYKLKTQKVKDLSRVLTALGPHGVQITKNVEHKVMKDKDGDTSMKTKSGKETVQIRGFSSVLANAEIEEEIEEVKKEEPKKEAPKKIKKKKGKR